MSTPSGKIDQIFCHALEIASESERRAFLDQACDGDTELRRRVEKMLHAQPKAERFLETPLGSFAPTLDQTVSQQLGTSIGPYKIIEEIGEGGMGLVYMARQQKPVKHRSCPQNSCYAAFR